MNRPETTIPTSNEPVCNEAVRVTSTPARSIATRSWDVDTSRLRQRFKYYGQPVHSLRVCTRMVHRRRDVTREESRTQSVGEGE